MSSFGWGPGAVDIEKIIWDKESAALWISGFRSSIPVDEKWEDRILAYFELIEPPASGVCENFDEWEW